MNKINISWEDVDDLVNELAISIKLNTPNINYIYGLPRGGLIPAVILSHILDIPMTDYKVPVIHYGEDQVLIVDDICDSGETLKKYENYQTAVLHYKPHTSCCEPTLWSTTHKTDEWVVYPWERRDSVTIQDYLR